MEQTEIIGYVVMVGNNHTIRYGFLYRSFDITFIKEVFYIYNADWFIS